MNVERVAYGAPKDLSQSLHKSGEETPRHQLRTKLICRALYRTVYGAEATSECELTSHPNLESHEPMSRRRDGHVTNQP